MEGLGRIAVITNAFIIVLSSDFIPKMVYKRLYSNNTLEGYTNFSLSYFSTADFETELNLNTSEYEYCRYPAFRKPPWEEDKYEYTSTYFIVWGARLAFVVVFQNLVAFTIMTVRWIIPDIPQTLRDRIRREVSRIILQEFFCIMKSNFPKLKK